MNGKITVMHFVSMIKPGGAPNNILRFCKNSSRTDSHVVSYVENIEMANEFLEATTLHNIDLSKISFTSLIRLVRVVYLVKPKIIHAHGRGGAFYATFLSLLYRDILFFYTFRGFNVPVGLRGFLYAVMEHIFYWRVTTYLAVSESEMEKVKARFPFMIHKLCKVPNGILDHANEIVPINGLDDGFVNIVSLSRVSPEKGLIDAVYLINKLVHKYNIKNIRLYIIGGCLVSQENYRLEVMLLIDKLSLSNYIILFGEIPFASRLLPNFNIYLSTSHWEGLPTAIIEAMSVKLPVVATNCVGNRDVVNDENGFVFDVGDYESGAKSLLNCIGNSIVTKNKVLVAEKFVVDNFSISKHVSLVEQLYSRALKSDNGTY